MTENERKLLDALAKVCRGLLWQMKLLDPLSAHIAQTASDTIGNLELTLAAERKEQEERMAVVFGRDLGADVSTEQPDTLTLDSR